jgi:hypothetical protein
MPFLAGAIAIGTGTVLVLITVVVAPIAAIAFARSGPAWEQIGRGPLAIEPQAPSAEEERPPPPGDPQLRAEVRELVLAANERRTRRGEPALEVEVEVDRRLAASSPTPAAGIS